MMNTLRVAWAFAIFCGASACAQECDALLSAGQCGASLDLNDSAQPGDWLRRLEDRIVESRSTGGRWFLSEYDFDNRGFNVLHFMGHSPLPLGFSLWGFIDLEGDDTVGSNREDLARYFLELDLKKSLWKNGGLVAEINDLHGPDNAIGRFGAYWQPNTGYMSPEEGPLSGKFKLGFKVFPLETDGRGGQLSFNWNKQFDGFGDGRLSAGGFFDWNYDVGAVGNEARIVTEHQVRFRVLEGLHLITEFRVNEFLQDDFGIAPGVQYRF